MQKKTWAVIGGGNGGQAFAGHLAILGQNVRIYDKIQATVDALNAKGGIQLKHAVDGFGKIEFASTDMGKVMDGADNILLVLPSLYHESISRECIPHLRDGQVILINPEASCGALAFRKMMRDLGCNANATVGASCTLLYSCRATEPGTVYIYGIKNEVPYAAMPSSDNQKLDDAINPALPWFKLVPNVAYTSLLNINAMMHPAPMILNTSRIEADPPQDYQYYLDGITPSIGSYVEKMDKERSAIAKAFGFEIPTINEQYATMYFCGKATDPLHMLCKNNPGYIGIMCSKTLRTRYVLEDIPYSLVALQALAQVVDVKTPYIDAIVAVGYGLLEGELDEGRTAKNLGIDSMTKEELLHYLND